MLDDNQWMTSTRGSEPRGPFTLGQLVEGVRHLNTLSGIYVMHPTKTQGEWVDASRIKPIVSAFADKPVEPQPQRSSWCCPYCQSRDGVAVVEKISTAGWVIFFLCLFSCVGTLFCWLPLMLKESNQYCKQCHTKIG